MFFDWIFFCLGLLMMTILKRHRSRILVSMAGLIVDINADGLLDMVATIDRGGTIKDSLSWFRNLGQ